MAETDIIRTGNVRVPGALTATDIDGVVVYTGDVKDDAQNKTLREINQEFYTLQDTVDTLQDTVDNLSTSNPQVDLTGYYKKGEVDTKLALKVNTTSIIQTPTSTLNGQTINNVDFSQITLTDYTKIPSLYVFKKLVPQVLSGGTMNHVAYNKELFENSYGYLSVSDRTKVPTITEVIETINGYNYLYNPYVLTGTEADSHSSKPLSESVYSAEYLNSLMFGSGGFSGLNASSMKDYVDNVKSLVVKLTFDTTDGEVWGWIDGIRVDNTAIFNAINSRITDKKPIIIYAQDNNGDESMYTASLQAVVDSSKYYAYIYTLNSVIEIFISEDGINCIYKRLGNVQYDYALSEAAFKLVGDNDVYSLQNPTDEEDEDYTSLYSIKNLYNMASKGAPIPLWFKNVCYYPLSVEDTYSEGDTIELQYFNAADYSNKYHITLTIYKNHLVHNDYEYDVTVEEDGGAQLQNYLESIVGDADIEVPLSNGTSIQDTTVETQLGWLHNTKIEKIYIGGVELSGAWEQNRLCVSVNLDAALPDFYIPDDKAAVLSTITSLNGTSASVGTNYKYDFSGNGTINTSADYEAYLALRANLVPEVNGLIRKIAKYEDGSVFANYSDYTTLAGKVYAGLYGNNTGTNTLADNTKLQSLKAVVDWLGLKSSIGNSLGTYITNVSEGIYQTITGSDESVLYLSETQGNSGLQFVSNLASLGYILGSSSFYTKEGETSYTPVESMDMVGIIGHEGDSYIMTAGGIEKLVGDITGFNYSYVDFSNYNTIKDRLESLEGFKETFDDEDFSPEDTNDSISTLNTNVRNLSDAVDAIESTISFIDANTITNIGNLVTTINIKAGSGDTITPKTIETGTHTIDLTALASRTYVDNAISNIESLGNLTLEDLNRLDALADNISNYATTELVGNAVEGVVKSVKIQNTAKEPNSNGQVYFSKNDLEGILQLDSYRKKTDIITWSDITTAEGEKAPLTEITDEQIAQFNYVKSSGITGVKRNGVALTSTNGVVDVKCITKVNYSVDGSAQNPLTPNANGEISLGNILRTIPEPTFKVRINDTDIAFNVLSTSGNTTVKGFNLGNGYIKGSVLNTTNPTDINNALGSELITMNTLAAYYNSRENETNKIPASTVIGNNIFVEPNKVYYNESNGLSTLNITLRANGSSNEACVYTIRFNTGDTFDRIRLRVVANSITNINSVNNASILRDCVILYPTNITWIPNTGYEVSILYDGHSYSLKQIPLAVADSPDAQGFTAIG